MIMKPFNLSDYSTKSTPKMSLRTKPIAQSRVTDTQASSQERYNQMYGTLKPKTNKPVSATPTKTQQNKSPDKSLVKNPQVKNPQVKFEEDIRKQIEGAYQQQVNFLTEQEASLQGQLPDYLSSISKQYETQQPFLEQQLQEQQQTGLTQQEQLKQQEQGLLAQSRRTAEEAGIRNIQQFGGVAGSSTAQAAGELLGREQLRQQGNIAQQRVQGIQNIQDQLRAIKGEYNAQVANLNLQKEQSLSNARLEFQKQLNSIKKERMQAGVTKSQMTIDALTSFSSRRQAIEDQVASQQNSLTLLREQATLNAQNARLQQSLTPQGINQIPADFKTSFFSIGQPNQSNELAKILQAGMAAGTIKPFGKNATGEDLFLDGKGAIVDIKGNIYGNNAPLQTL